MKKLIVLVVVVVLLSLSLLIGCSKIEAEKPENKIEELTGYMVIKDNTVHFDQVEIIKREDEERIKELDLDESDMPSGYAIINEKQEETIYELADKVEYIFTDVYFNFIEESKVDRLYTTTKKDEFLKHLNEYNLNEIPLSEQTIPYFIKIQDGKVISIEEKMEYTI